MDDPDDPKTPPPPDIPPKAAKKAKYLQKYAKHWECLFFTYIQGMITTYSVKGENRAYCKACDCELSEKNLNQKNMHRGRNTKLVLVVCIATHTYVIAICQ